MRKNATSTVTKGGIGRGPTRSTVPCSLCDQPKAALPRSEWWEVKSLGLARRVHSACFREVEAELRGLPEGELLRMVEEHEAELRQLAYLLKAAERMADA